MGLTDAVGNAWNNTVNAVTNPTETFSKVAQEAWEAPKNFVDNVSETIDAPRLMDALKDGSPKEVFDWGKENANGGFIPLAIDGVFGTNVSSVTSSFAKNLGDTLVDDSVNGLVHAGGWVQAGLENINVMPDMKQIDQVLPDLDLYENPDFDNASTAETIAGRAGQVAGYALPLVGTAGAVIKGGKAAFTAYQEGHLLSTITDKATDVLVSAKDKLPAWMKPGSKTTDEAAEAAETATTIRKPPTTKEPADSNGLPKEGEHRPINDIGKIDANGVTVLNASETEQLYAQTSKARGELQFAKPDLKPGDKKYYQVNANQVDLSQHPAGLRVGSTESRLTAESEISLADGQLIPKGELPNGVQISGDVIHTPPAGVTLDNGTILRDGTKLPAGAEISGGQKVTNGDWVITRETMVDGKPGYDVYTPHSDQFDARWRPVDGQPGQYSPKSVPTDMVYLPEGKYEIPTSWGTASGEGPAFLAKYGPDDYNIITVKDAKETGYLDNPTNDAGRQFLDNLPGVAGA